MNLKHDEMAQTVFIWLRINTRGTLLYIRQ